MRILEEFEYSIVEDDGNHLFEGEHIGLYNCGTVPVEIGKRTLLSGQSKQYEAKVLGDFFKVEKTIKFRTDKDMLALLTNNGQTELGLDLVSGCLLRVEIIKEKNKNYASNLV